MLCGSVRFRLMSYAIVCRRSGLTIPASPGISALLGLEAALTVDVGPGVVPAESNPWERFISGRVSGCSECRDFCV